MPVAAGKIGSLSGWRFGTFFIFPYIGLLIIPIGVHIFQRGGEKPPTRSTFGSSRSLRRAQHIHSQPEAAGPLILSPDGDRTLHLAGTRFGQIGGCAEASVDIILGDGHPVLFPYVPWSKDG